MDNSHQNLVGALQVQIVKTGKTIAQDQQATTASAGHGCIGVQSSIMKALLDIPEIANEGQMQDKKPQQRSTSGMRGLQNFTKSTFSIFDGRK